MSNKNPVGPDPLQGILDLIGEALRPGMLEALEITTLIGRLISRAANESQTTTAHEMGSAEIDILVALAARGDPFRAKPSEVAAWSGVTGAAITARVDRLEGRGLVGRTIDSTDRRIRWITLTPAGNAMIQHQALKITESPLFLEIQNLSENECTTLRNILKKLI